MNVKSLIFVFCFLSIFISSNCSAINGWQWGIRNTGKGGMVTQTSVSDLSGNVYACGHSWAFDSTVFGSHTVYNPGHEYQAVITKADNSGHYLWAIASRYAYATFCGSDVDASGNLYTAGYYSGDSIRLGGISLSNAIPSEPMFFVAKISASGTVLWAQNVITNSGGSAPIYFALGVDGIGNANIILNFYQNVIMYGGTHINHNTTSFPTSDILLAKYNTNGILKWTKTFGGDYTEWIKTGGNAFAYDTRLMSVTKNGNIYFVGETYSDSIVFGATTVHNPGAISSSIPAPYQNYLVKCDSNGNVLWTKNIDKKANVGGIVADGQEHLYISGTLDSIGVFGSATLNPGALLAKYDSAGNNIWARTMKGGEVSCVTLDTSRHVFICGPILDSVMFSTTTLHSLNNDDVFLAQFDTAGSFLKCVNVGGSASGYSNISADNFGGVLVTGNYFMDTLFFGPNTLDTSNIYSTTAFIARYKFGGSTVGIPGIDPLQITAFDFSLLPNPAQSVLNIIARSSINSVVIADNAGRVIYRRNNIGSEQMQLQISDLIPGMYYIVVNEQTVQRFIKQ